MIDLNSIVTRVGSGGEPGGIRIFRGYFFTDPYVLLRNRNSERVYILRGVGVHPVHPIVTPL